MSENNDFRRSVPELYPPRVERDGKSILMALLSVVVAIVVLVLITMFFSYISPLSFNYGKTWGFINGGVVETQEAADATEGETDAQTEEATAVEEETAADTLTESVTADTDAAETETTESVDAAAEVQTEDAAAAETSDDYIFSDSSERLLTAADLEGKSDWDLRIARNEIFARHGRKFVDEDIANYFNSKSWYSGTIEPDDFNYDTMLNDTERANINLIESYEN